MGNLHRGTLVIAVFLLFADLGKSEDTSPNDSLLIGAPNIYFDCSFSDQSDQDFIRTEIPFVNFVRDRALAEVHVLLSSQQTGSGGDECTIEFIGQGRFEGMRDTLIYVSLHSDTEDLVRKGLAQTIRLGLTRFAARTPVAKELSVRYARPSKQADISDKWNFWVFTVELNGWINGTKSYKEWYLNNYISAKRITKDLKLDCDVWINHQEQKYTYGDYRSLTISRGKGFSGNAFFSLGRHWSVGSSTDVSSSTFSNVDISTYNSLAVEYNIFPYDESTRRQLRLVHSLAALYVDYIDETIYDEWSEWYPRQRVAAYLTLVQPWGSTSLQLQFSHYFKGLKRNRLYVYGNVSVNMFGGFDLSLNGYAIRVRDQFGLPKGDASQEDILLQRRLLETGYEYNMSVGISYTFGSKYNNVVNPRFGN